MSVIYLAGGCFWGMEKYLSGIHGVLSTQAGFANGSTLRPTYEDVCRRGTGHAETVMVEYDSSVLSLQFLLNLYFEAIDPTALNRQGGDCGTQYRTGIYYTDDADVPVIENAIRDLQEKYDRPIAVEVTSLKNYFPAEEYHQKYLDKNPNGYCHIGRPAFERASQAIINPSKYTKPEPEVLKGRLNDLQYHVTQEGATETPFTNDYWNHFAKGIYVDITTGEPLFASSDKFESGCGWPSFSRPIDPDVVREKTDLSHDMKRTEVRSRTGGAHLGHVFDDGPEKTGGQRYCINSAALRFVPADKMRDEGYGYLFDMIK